MAENDLEERPRRRRYQKVDSEGCLLTPKKQGLLLHLSECRLLSLPQLATLGNLTQRAARKHLRPMFDGGLVSVVAVPRSVLAEQDDPNDDSLLYGSAPNIYTPTREGLRYLYALGKIDRDEKNDIVPGARVQKVYSLMERGLAWRENIAEDAAYLQLLREIRETFPLL